MSSVIDTNVLIVANGNSGHASIDCELACIDLLEKTTALAIVIDENTLIMSEYQKHCSHKGAPGVGDMFFKYLHDNQHDPSSSILQVKINPIPDVKRSFSELPENEFDLSDRKFLATAVAANAEVINSTDSDWEEQSGLMQQLDVTISQLCPDCNNKS